ncbi:DNA-binding transcriptional regulator, IclR family [Micromonospora phaseoli]|uniref:Glycerol operon regulatory protein n=1 Tax=Micromonospora phaseoli TaxID=1144548 RepID=A0A1H6V6A5_9ACTN|nr:IclR family transcriptional regulator [Micromonospora phaseoli]PZV99159.1 IclR family transcriptional regulator [Micromonospora phaseoli]GIJ78639.1 IclR family transcriptional regulator [Micromonospora phaseoli]SEI95812.1 DNA-binding transcriptional regulator, IclR family [Micromonospora phaseoli]
MSSAPEEFQPVKSAGRTLDLLELLADQPHPWALGDLARALGIPKSSLHGLLRTLTSRGWVQTDETGTRFRLGLRALRVGAAYLDGDDRVGLLAGVLDELSRRFGEAVHLGRLDGDQVVYLAKRESVHRLRLYSAIGRRLPAHATALGKALLAEHSDQEVDGLLSWPPPRLTPHTVTDRDALHAALAAVRRTGYAVDREENAEGIMCFAMAVPLVTPAVDAVSVSVPVTRLRPELEASIVTALRETVGGLTRARSMLST